MKMKSKITNSYDRVPKNDSATEKVKDLASPLALSRPNEKYGATAIATAAAAADAATSDARPVKVGFDLVIIYLSVLLSDMTRGILFPTMWLFVLSLGGSKSSQGLAVASFSFGRVLFSPAFGSASEKYGDRKVLTVCNIIIALGTLVYSSASSLYILILGQFLMGVGAASLGVTRSYVAEHSRRQDRTAALADLTAMQYFGFTVTPVIGAILAAVGNKNRFIIPLIRLPINEYSLPALFMGILAIGNAVLLHHLFPDKTVSTDSMHSFSIITDTAATTAASSAGDVTSSEGLLEFENKSRTDPPVVNLLSSVWNMDDTVKVVIGSCVLNIAMKGTIGVFETLGSEFVSKNFHWDSLYTGYTFATFGLMGVFCLLSFPLLQKFRINDLDVMTIGAVLMTLSCFLISSDGINIPPGQFYFSLALMYVLGYPLGHTSLLGATSKIYGDGPQGSVMGWFAASGSFSRIIFPMMAGLLAEHVSDSFTFATMGSIMVTCSFCLTFYRTRIASVIDPKH